MCDSMRSLLLAAALLTVAARPAALGHFEDWRAATHVEGGRTVCFAYTRAAKSAPVLRGRGDVVLTVTERPSSEDAVALSAGFAYPLDASVPVHVSGGQLGAGRFDFYTAQRSAFARDGHAVVAELGRQARAVAVSPGPRGGDVVDTFSLKGFPAALQAARRACAKT